MKIVLSPDSLKGSLSAADACRAMERACRRVFPDCAVVSLPGGDGGEGTLGALEAAWGSAARRVTVRVKGLLGETRDAQWLFREEDRTAAVESARAAGLAAPGEEKDVLRADSFGVGQMILSALDAGAKTIYVTLGGTGSNDCGTGLLRALGASFRDENGNETAPGGGGLGGIAAADFSRLDARLAGMRLLAVTDVDNPLLGENGATRIYGPQKGADAETVEKLEKGMANCAEKMRRALGRDVSLLSGAGAAGGMGAALIGVLGAERLCGAQAVLDAMGFDEKAWDADLILTGEGRMDVQSVSFGKYPAAVARRGERLGVPVIALVGGRTPDADAFLSIGRSALFSLPDGPMPLSEAVNRAADLMERAAENALRVYRMGMEGNAHGKA